MNSTQKTAVVTGGAHGIGKCIADEFRKEGVKVYVIDKAAGDHYVGDLSDKAVLEDFAQKVIHESGGISYVLNTLRSFCLGSKYTFLKRKLMCAIICALQVITLIFTWDKWWSVLPVAANIAATIGGYTHNGQKIRIAGMFINSPLWIIYDILVGSWAGILDEIVTEASMIISIIRYGWKNLDSAEN